jgi:hypothetical protein
MRRFVLALTLAACGGGPVLQNLPRPNPAVVAGIAAGAAAAATVANPGAAGKPKETEKPLSERQPVRVKETIPGDVLDRMEQQDAEEARAAGNKPVP